jgi:hypothetical protein
MAFGHPADMAFGHPEAEASGLRAAGLQDPELHGHGITV